MELIKKGYNVKAAKEDWSGRIFANNWEILKKLSCAQYREIYQEMTGDTTKQIKNTHYLIRNNTCGIETYMERTVIDRIIKNNSTLISKCRGCNNGSKKNNCYYATKCRNKPLYKIPDRKSKINPGETYGLFYVISVEPSSITQSHSSHAKVKCTLCGKEQIANCDQLSIGSFTCDCFRNHSTGEKLIENFLQMHNYIYKSEKTFEDLVGDKGGFLRYDFAVYDNKNQLKVLIEFDGQQHFKVINHWGGEESFKQRQNYDIIKNNYAKNHKIPLLRINYKDILKIDEILNKFLQENI